MAATKITGPAATGILRTVWTLTGVTETGAAENLAQAESISVTVAGTLASNALVLMQGSNDGTNYVTVTDDEGDPISLDTLPATVALGDEQRFRFLRPVIGGTAEDSSTVTVTAVSALSILGRPGLPGDKGDAGEAGADPEVLVASKRLSSAEVLGMYATPVELVPPAGANRIVVPIHAHLALAFGTIAYTGGGDVQIGYKPGSVTDILSYHPSIIRAESSSFVGELTAWNDGAQPITSAVDLPLIITNITEPFVAGDGTLLVTVIYHVVDLTA